MWGALISLFKIMTKMVFVLAVIFAFVALLGIVVSAMSVTVNNNVLQDVYSIVSIWMPFNLNVMILWLVTAALVYIMYRLTWVGLTFINNLLRE
jgi:hypothetical protein